MTPTAHLFIFGNTPDLAFLELQSFFPNVQRIRPEVARVVDSLPLPAHEFLRRLGGTVKIAEGLGECAALAPGALLPFFEKQKSVHFGVSVYGASLPKSLPMEVKRLLEQTGVHVRFAASRHGSVLASVTVDKQAIDEYLFVALDGGFVIGKTLAVQDYEDWSERDYGRPHADAKSGMLPPKVARMIVNIAGAPGTLLDPFCGMGTILAEAYLSGWSVIGSDISAEAVQKAKANLDWLGATSTMYVSDATHVSEKIEKNLIAAIVTEPFMGDTSIALSDKRDNTKIKNAVKGLEKLYIGCLREWTKILVPGGVVVMALPEYSVGGRTYFVKKVIDMCENLGYTTQAGPIEYGRPQAIVKRKFFVFKKISINY